MSSDRFYFRQLLSGRDFATDDPVAQQMVNFVYAIGDRATSNSRTANGTVNARKPSSAAPPTCISQNMPVVR